MRILYTAHATAVGGRNGHAETDDKNLAVELSSPGAPNKKPGASTNPEQLFACGYAACFGSAVEAVAKQKKITVSNVEVKADVNLRQDDDGYSISAALSVTIPNLDDKEVSDLVEAAHKMCPYSKATQGNIEVKLTANGKSLLQAA